MSDPSPQQDARRAAALVGLVLLVLGGIFAFLDRNKAWYIPPSAFISLALALFGSGTIGFWLAAKNPRGVGIFVGVAAALLLFVVAVGVYLALACSGNRPPAR